MEDCLGKACVLYGCSHFSTKSQKPLATYNEERQSHVYRDMVIYVGDNRVPVNNIHSAMKPILENKRQ